ncbi:DUF4287 domain-containing protein [Deinococcus sp.]|uniref:DUF4287 domain-containing protein n=1 Tax=Deinococcus sp. TaxID=47478 RepID=UPI003CC51F25
MSFQAYLDSVQAQTGKTPDDFRTLAAEKRLSKHGEIIQWLKTDFALGHGHANAVAAVLLKSDLRKAAPDERADALFTGKKAHWKAAFDALWAEVSQFGDDLGMAPTESYISLLRGKKKFTIVQPSTAERLDIGLKLKGMQAAGRLEAAGSWNSMVTHRVRVSKATEIDAELLEWLKQAYGAS